MERAKAFSWMLTAFTVVIVGLLWAQGHFGNPYPASELIFWIALLLVSQLLPVSLGFETQVTMAFPIVLATAILFEPAFAMIIVGLGAIDPREFRREIPLWHALFNRCQMMITAGAASGVIALWGRNPFTFPEGTAFIALAAVALIATNLGSVTIWVHTLRGVPLREALRSLVPRPAAGFWVAQALLAALGATTAAAYHEIGFFVAAFLIPLLFARLGILGARTQQELSERLRKQQEALLVATEQVFQERENERKRIASEIHDGSLQMMAAASYGAGNAGEYLAAGKPEEATKLLSTTQSAVDGAIKALRGSLVDLRRSSVEAGGLLETIKNYVDQVSTLWGTEVRIEGSITHEPPIPVALAAFQILQEGLINALKHGNSPTITVRITDEGNMVHIVVEDDGPGFDPQVEIGPDHVGMRLMKERAARVGGWIELDSALGRGTRLVAVLPGAVSS
jgi:signal transduction histidine kinase